MRIRELIIDSRGNILSMLADGTVWIRKLKRMPGRVTYLDWELLTPETEV